MGVLCWDKGPEGVHCEMSDGHEGEHWAYGIRGDDWVWRDIEESRRLLAVTPMELEVVMDALRYREDWDEESFDCPRWRTMVWATSIGKVTFRFKYPSEPRWFQDGWPEVYKVRETIWNDDADIAWGYEMHTYRTWGEAMELIARHGHPERLKVMGVV